MLSKLSKVKTLKNVTVLTVYLIIVWGFYRYLFQFPEEIEELVIKPVVWVLPVLYFVTKEKGSLNSLGLTLQKLFPSIYLALGLGALFAIEALLINYLKYGSFEFAANIGDKPFLYSFLLSTATAFSEELTFRGYIFNRLWWIVGNEFWANIITSLAWALIHVPITIFVWKLSFSSSIIYLGLTTLFGIGSAWVFARTKNVTSSILLHLLWEWPIVLFR